MITIDQLVPHLLDLPSLEEDMPPPPGSSLPRHVCAPVVIYDDLEAGHRARELITSLTERFQDHVEVDPIFWRFELLGQPDDRNQALSDAANARLIILSASGDSELPDAVAEWWQSCLEARHGMKTAVIVLLGEPGHFDGPESPRLQFLKDVAREAGAQFFAPSPPWQHLHSATFENLHAREEAMTPTLDGILHHAPEISPTLSLNP